MNEDQNIEQSSQGAKTESPKQMNDESQAVNHETSNVNEEAKPLTINNELLTNMEVHHHPNLHHRRKHFKEYLLEGLMIFIAVTLGFFAESYREYLSDRSKEKEYMQSMYKDLQADTLNLNLIIRANNSVTHDGNALTDIFSNEIVNHETIVNAYALYERSTLTAYNATLSDATLSQLKNNGGFRILKNKKVINAILDYDGLRSEIILNTEGLLHSNEMVYDNDGRKIFDTRYVRNMLDSLITAPQTFFCFYPIQKLKVLMEDNQQIKLMTDDATIIGDLCNDLRTYINIIANYDALLKIQKDKADNLMSLIQTEYN